MNGDTGARGDVEPGGSAPRESAPGDWLVARLLVGAVTVVALGAALLVGVVHAYVASCLGRVGSGEGD